MTSRTVRSPDGRARSIAGWAIGGLVVWLLLLTWALGIGRYGGPDEPAHITRAAAVADGQVRGAPATGMAGGFRVVSVPSPLASGDPSCYRHDPTVPATCSDAADTIGRSSVATSAGINPPLYYALVGFPVRWLGQADDTTWYRLVAVFWNALVLLLVVWRASRRRAGRAHVVSTLAVVAAVTPAAWFLFGVVNPNGLEVALALLAWVSLPSCRDAASRTAACWWVAGPAAIAIAIRPISVVWVAALAAVFLARTRWTYGWAWRHRVVLVAPIAAAGVAVAAWNAWIGLEFDDPRTADHGGRLDVLRSSLGGIPSTLREMVGSAGWLEYSMPAASQLVWWIGALAVVVTAWRQRDAGMRGSLVGWATVLTLGPVVFEVVAADRVGLIWQGRYSIPTTMAVAASAVAIVDRRDTPWARLDRRTIVAAAAVVALAELAAYWTTLHRSTVGTAGSWWFVAATDARWDPLVPPLALLAVHAAVLATAVLATAVLATAVDPVAAGPVTRTWSRVDEAQTT